jgi:hypothetical protein
MQGLFPALDINDLQDSTLANHVVAAGYAEWQQVRINGDFLINLVFSRDIVIADFEMHHVFGIVGPTGYRTDINIACYYDFPGTGE